MAIYSSDTVKRRSRVFETSFGRDEKLEEEVEDKLEDEAEMEEENNIDFDICC